MTKEHERLKEALARTTHWRRWGPYLSSRQWGTVREDYSASGDAWGYFPHDHARSRAYRWGEDGILGISDNHQRLCFAPTFWNGKDSILKERLFGLTNGEGNHGEDVKEIYYFLDNVPTHSYMKALYRYPQEAFPYQTLLDQNRQRGRYLPEFELVDTGIFRGNRYFDILVEYAKAGVNDILVRIEGINRGPEPAALHVLPTVWFRNTWSWNSGRKPKMGMDAPRGESPIIKCEHDSLGVLYLAADAEADVLFTENETNFQRLFGTSNHGHFCKDGIHEFILFRRSTVNPEKVGTKAAFHYQRVLQPGESWQIRLRLSDGLRSLNEIFGETFETIFALRKREADEFYDAITSNIASPEQRDLQRQALAGLLWNRQFYHYIVSDWLRGDPADPPPPAARSRNRGWEHIYTDDILSVPDNWEYPWFAAWDLAFHCIPMAMIDPEFAKRQLVLLTREWYMHPNGQIPAYEWDFCDVNPPVHAWAAWRVYTIEREMCGHGDRLFLERVFQKLLLNFTWWVNREDAVGDNIFEGGFLGLDNIGIFDRSQPLPRGGFIEESDGTSWMAMYCLNLLVIAIELARENPSYEDIASKFFEHFLRISYAMNHVGSENISLWDETDGFFYDCLRLPDAPAIPLKVRSLVGLIPLFAVETLELESINNLPGFRGRTEWFLEHRPDLSHNVTCRGEAGVCDRRILSVVSPDQLRRILSTMLSEDEFLSPFGIRSLSRHHRERPFVLSLDGDNSRRIDCGPAESTHGLFGGNSNWRGPVWLPVNFLMIESLQKFHRYFGDQFKVECPTGSGQLANLWEVSREIARRNLTLFPKGETLFYEYFNAETGAGLGASHQTGWTALVAQLIRQFGQ